MDSLACLKPDGNEIHSALERTLRGVRQASQVDVNREILGHQN
jgi:hypothetical protein